MNIIIKELTPEIISKYDVANFLFTMIKKCYKLDYTPQYHYDVVNLEQYYIKPEKSNFFVAIDSDENKVIATSAIRAYDKNYDIKDKHYTKDKTASIYRVFVDEQYRRCKIATRLLGKIEEFCIKKEYNEIYLHTQRDSCGALPFWLHNNYQITHDTQNELGTIHMEKIIKK
ncbi:MAG: GNAT family N-acetyltransferase [Methanosphaera sp. rholeuAM74]|nr:MAG: GNAT family N-acetyltransferase [Methanosphaera sp. rholeuAM74]